MSWTWASARCRGTSHVRSDTECQDALYCALVGPVEDVFVAIVSDGAGSAAYGKQGAIIVCRTIMTCARRHFSQTEHLPTDADVRSWLDDARDAIATASEHRSLERRQLAATLVAVLAAKDECLVLHIGDGGAVVRGHDTGWICPSWPANGEYASMTYFVTDDPEPQLRITRVSHRVNCVAVFSDGLERLALDFARQNPHAPFFDGMFRPVLQGAKTGKNKKLSQSLATYLDSAAVNDRTDDDKSLILAARR